MKPKKQRFLTEEGMNSVRAEWRMLAEKLGKCEGVRMILDDYRTENFTAKEWALGSTGALVFILITSIL